LYINASESKGFSGSHIGLIVETLNGPSCHLVFACKPIEKIASMRPEHLGHSLHRVESGAHGSTTPGIQKLGRPRTPFVCPELLKVLFENIRPDCFEVDVQQLLKFDCLPVSQVFWSFEQAPPAAGQYRFFAFGLQFPGFRSPNLINGFAKMGHDMKPVNDLKGLVGLFGHNSQIRFPHITDNKTKPGRVFLAELPEKLYKRLLGPILSNPQQPLGRAFNLINHGQVLVAFPSGKFINADSRYIVQAAVLKAPLYSHLHRTKDIVPGGLKGFGHFFPGQPPSPSGQKPLVGRNQMTFALRPGHPLNLYPTGGTGNASHGIKKEHRDAPHRDKLKPALGQNIVARSGLFANRTFGPGTLAGTNLDSKSPCLVNVKPVDILVNKTLLQLDPIKDRLDLHPASFLLLDKFGTLFKSGIGAGCFFSKSFQNPGSQGCHGPCSRKTFDGLARKHHASLSLSATLIGTQSVKLKRTHKFC